MYLYVYCPRRTIRDNPNRAYHRNLVMGGGALVLLVQQIIDIKLFYQVVLYYRPVLYVFHVDSSSPHPIFFLFIFIFGSVFLSPSIFGRVV